MKTTRIISSITSLLLVAILLSPTMLASADESIGGASRDPTILAAAATAQSLGSVVSEYGRIKLSIDALGISNAQGDIQVDKPNGGKVRKAYLLSATTGFTGYRLANGDVKINGNDISWEKEISNSIDSYNYWVDVTNIIKSTIDAAPAGIVALQISELNTSNIDGEILAVIFDDPNQGTNNTIILYFGAQNIAGDTFTINTGSPINTNDPNLKLNLSLGISYGCLGDSSCAGGANAQYSQVDVNGQRLTTSAGGQDDGENPNGSLITAGGIGDSDDNPSDPYAVPLSARSDDELYNLKPFVKNNDTTIQINTKNPSNDDNIFFAALMLTATSTIQTINVDISLAKNPTTNEEQAPYENIVRYFADAIFEESNGANKLGTVTFHTNGDFADQANVIWGARGRPNSDPAGYGIPGKHINMYDTFQDGSDKGIDYNFLADDKHQKAAGYTLAHEFGHLYYSLYDEYKCSGDECAEWDKLFWRPHTSDKSVTNSIMNSQWNTFGLFGDNYNWLNFSIAKNISGDTAQYRVYGASGWDTLARPISQDPQALYCSTLPVRLYHSELANVKPAPDENSRIDLPGTARSELGIIWDNELIASTGSAILSTSVATIPYTAELNSSLGQNISYPDPLILETFVHQDLNITDLHVIGSITLPDGSTQTVQFADDGIPPDVLGGDGLYSAILNYTMNGLYAVQVTLDNHALNGKLVAYGFLMSTDINGNSVPYPDPQPATDDFELSRSLLISVSNVVTDDHGNTPDLATRVTSDNVTIPGKIESTGDADVFKITTLPAGITFIRLTHLAFGITPHVRVLAPDKQSVLYELDLPSTGEGSYLNVALTKVPPGTTVYVEVTDELANFGGLYRFSAGAQLASDTAEFVSILYLTENRGTLRRVDQATGATATVGNLGTNGIVGLSNRPGDTKYIYGVEPTGLNGIGSSRLVKINTLTGETAPLLVFDESTLGISSPTAYGIAISPLAPNIAVITGVNINNGVQYYLWKADVNTGSVLGVATPTSAWLNELAYSRDGSVLYGVNIDGQLVTVNSDTGAVTLVGDPGLSPYIEGLAFRPGDGALFAIDGYDQDRLVRLDPTNGSLIEVVGSLGVVGPYGLAFIPSNQLSVSKSGGGSGTITSSPAGINCGSTCSYEFNANTEVTLTATADASSTFTGWSGGGCAGTGTCSVTMSASTAIMASFAKTSLKPGAATLRAPSGIVISSQPTFSWDVSPDDATTDPASWYYLWINGPSGKMLNQWYEASTVCGAGSCSVTPNILLGSGSYTWWVQTWNVAGTGPWSAAMTFSLYPVGGATLVSPSGYMGANYSPTYSWNAVSGATWYYLWVSGPGGNVIKQWYTSADANCNASICSVTPAITLAGGNHTWWVQTWNAVGLGPWSSGMSFTTTPLAAATLVSPNGNLNANYNPAYTWNKVTGATWYYLWVNGPSGPVIQQWYTAAEANCDSATCSVTPAKTLSGGNHTWWIQTWNAAGLGPWSSGMSFTTTPLGAATLVSPSGSIASHNPSYTWNAVPGATWYYLWVNGPSGPVIQQWYTSAQANCNASSCSVTPATTLSSGSHTWWIQTWNSAGIGPWSGAKNFMVTP